MLLSVEKGEGACYSPMILRKGLEFGYGLRVIRVLLIRSLSLEYRK